MIRKPTNSPPGSNRTAKSLGLYSTIWIVGAGVLTVAHAMSGGRYETLPNTIVPSSIAAPPFKVTAPPDPFPEFMDEQISTPTTWATVPYLVQPAPAGSSTPSIVTSSGALEQPTAQSSMKKITTVKITSQYKKKNTAALRDQSPVLPAAAAAPRAAYAATIVAKPPTLTSAGVDGAAMAAPGVIAVDNPIVRRAAARLSTHQSPEPPDAANEQRQ